VWHERPCAPAPKSRKPLDEISLAAAKQPKKNGNIVRFIFGNTVAVSGLFLGTGN
jgi:hypothetical protein